MSTSYSSHHLLSLCLTHPIRFFALLPSPSKAIQVAHRRIIPQPLRHAGLVRLSVLSGFTLATEVKAAKIKFATHPLPFRVPAIKGDILDYKITHPPGVCHFKEWFMITSFGIVFPFYFAMMEPTMVSECDEECLVVCKCAKSLNCSILSASDSNTASAIATDS